jgi:GDP-D-mannose 3', 5'-epimerase
MRTALVTGGSGFIGSHLCDYLKRMGYYVRAVDIAPYQYGEHSADELIITDMSACTPSSVGVFTNPFTGDGFDEVYALACLMGGAGFVFSGDNDADIYTNNLRCNINTAYYSTTTKAKRVFYSSSACCYPAFNQTDPSNPNCAESTAYPAGPDSEYGWEKLISERMYLSYRRNYNLDVRIARFHNIFGEKGSWNNGKEKSPAALCRKVAETEDGGTIDIWGDGLQTRSFLYIDECLNGIRRLMDAPKSLEPLNIGSEEMVTINQLAEIIMDIAGKKLKINHISGPLGVRGRCSDNRLIQECLGWSPDYPLRDGLVKTYNWINEQVQKTK